MSAPSCRATPLTPLRSVSSARAKFACADYSRIYFSGKVLASIFRRNVFCKLNFVSLQEFCDWAFAKDFDLEDDIDSQADDEEEG